MSRSFESASSQYLHTDSLAVSGFPVSVSIWFVPNTTATTKSCGLWSIGDKDLAYTAGPITLNYSGDSNDQVNNMWENYWVGAGSTSPNNPVVDSWNHALSIWESSSACTIFSNGVKFRSTGLSGYAWNGLSGAYDSTRIGRWGDSGTDTGNYFDGIIDHVAVWDVILSDDEAVALSQGASPLIIRPASLKSYVPFIGRNSPEIDIISGATYSVNGSPSASNSEPPQLWPPSRKKKPIYLPKPPAASDLFVRSNGVLTSPWVKYVWPTTMSISSNKVLSNNLGVDTSYAYTGIDWSNDQYSEVTLGTPTNDAWNHGYGVSVRNNPVDGSCYRLGGSQAGWYLDWQNPTLTTWGAIAGGVGVLPTFVDGDRIGLLIVGTKLVCYKNGIQFATYTSSQFATGVPGICFSSTDAAGGRIITWSGYGTNLVAAEEGSWSYNPGVQRKPRVMTGPIP